MNSNGESGKDGLASAIEILREFNKWRRAEGEYEFNEKDPSSNKPCPFTPQQIGAAIDSAVSFMRAHIPGACDTTQSETPHFCLGESTTSDTILRVNTYTF